MIDLVICAPTKWGNPGGFDDNLYGACAICGEPIQYRPHAPAATEKVCAPCALATTTAGDVFVMTPEVREDLRRHAIAKAGR